MERPELTKEDLVLMVNSAENEFLIFIPLSKEGYDGSKEESIQT